MNFTDIRFLREVKNMTQIELAKKLNISRSAIAQWETGKGNPKLKHIEMLCEIFDCPIEFFSISNLRRRKRKNEQNK